MPSLAPRHFRRECAMTIYVITRSPFWTAGREWTRPNDQPIDTGNPGLCPPNADKRGLIASVHVGLCLTSSGSMYDDGYLPSVSPLASTALPWLEYQLDETWEERATSRTLLLHISLS